MADIGSERQVGCAEGEVDGRADVDGVGDAVDFEIASGGLDVDVAGHGGGDGDGEVVGV